MTTQSRRLIVRISVVILAIILIIALWIAINLRTGETICQSVGDSPQVCESK